MFSTFPAYLPPKNMIRFKKLAYLKARSFSSQIPRNGAKRFGHTKTVTISTFFVPPSLPSLYTTPLSIVRRKKSTTGIYERNMRHAISAVNHGHTYGAAARANYINRTTFHARVNGPLRKLVRIIALTEKEDALVSCLTKFAHHGVFPNPMPPVVPWHAPFLFRDTCPPCQDTCPRGHNPGHGSSSSRVHVYQTPRVAGPLRPWVQVSTPTCNGCHTSRRGVPPAAAAAVLI